MPSKSTINVNAKLCAEPFVSRLTELTPASTRCSHIFVSLDFVGMRDGTAVGTIDGSELGTDVGETDGTNDGPRLGT